MNALAKSGLHLAFYGDDFTGSTDALEVLAFAGLRCALFLKPPTQTMLDELGGFDAIGVAGESRSMSPEEMEINLPPIFKALKELSAPIIHYKVCSTFDSSPHMGSIGRVLEIARKTITDAPAPLIAGTPALKRYCLFGNLFARSGTDEKIYRIDRHPIMSMHPITPMDEADLIRHFRRQTDLRIANLNITAFDGGRDLLDEALSEAVASAPAAILFDTLLDRHQTETGRLIDLLAEKSKRLFTIGSSGVEYALTQWWRESGRIPPPSRSYDSFEPIPGVLSISGSASPLSSTQIDAAISAGFFEIAVDAASLVDESSRASLSRKVIADITAALFEGHSVIMHTAKGPHDSRISKMLDALEARGASRDEARYQGGRELGIQLGIITDAVLRSYPLRRLVLSGGDTSTQIMQVLGPEALEIKARFSPGAPLCRAISNKPHLENVEIALKGGQMGDASYFVVAREGRQAKN